VAVGAATDLSGRAGADTDRTGTATALTARLRRAEGQLRGVQRMIEEGADHRQVLTQLAAVKAAVDQVGLQLMSQRLRSCVAGGGDDCSEEFEQAMETFLRFASMAR
jgi:DNA-binding FrmR family transcriptional regulator